jgi:superfamily II DNA/RNA helicase
MISTKSAGARGLNYPDVQVVVEFDLPLNNFQGAVRCRRCFDALLV